MTIPIQCISTSSAIVTVIQVLAAGRTPIKRGLERGHQVGLYGIVEMRLIQRERTSPDVPLDGRSSVHRPGRDSTLKSHCQSSHGGLILGNAIASRTRPWDTRVGTTTAQDERYGWGESIGD
jgi:hypothetical protein